MLGVEGNNFQHSVTRRVILACAYMAIAAGLTLPLVVTLCHTREYQLIVFIISASCFIVIVGIILEWLAQRLSTVEGPVHDLRKASRVWAPGTFEDLKNLDNESLQFFHMRIKCSPSMGKCSVNKADPASVLTPPLQATSQACICCMDDFDATSNVAVLPCGHVFHEHCMVMWSLSAKGSTNACPVCRASFDIL
ncbi:RNF103 [Symbiodinium sp. CCMP2592]|nr:RNF103 [Symbiodinium sp. CCMP2592]